MFDSTHPPLLVQPIPMRYFTLFATHEGYSVHPLSSERALVSYKDGWTFPLTSRQQELITEPPVFLVKNSGCITSSGSTFDKGYAHQFCGEDGQVPAYISNQAIFPDHPSVNWMLIPDIVTMIWLQYGYKNQFCGGSSFDMERHYYGKILIRNFCIVTDFAPKLDKTADVVTPGDAKQYRVASRQIFINSWNEKDQDPERYLEEILSANHLNQFQHAVLTALKRAMAPPKLK